MTGGRAREIGPIGAASRAVGGLIAIAVPIALSGIGWWDVAAALVALPLITLAVSALVTAGYERYAPESLARRHSICSGPGCVLVAGVVAVAIALAVATPVSEVAIWSFFGVSMLVAALRGYAGCEVLAIPNAITGRRDRIGCVLYTPIDAAEARGKRSRAVSDHVAEPPGGVAQKRDDGPRESGSPAWRQAGLPSRSRGN
ncbi:MAG TPA: hypothetical protein VE465_09180 [Streptosporangiaceae bacterium]|nr:hypothetical protein [Streptosporangiaceae bacterium]